jgi:hypothetical protein
MLKYNLFSKSEIHCVLVWGHGMPFLKEIILELEKNKSFEILKIQKHIPKKINAFIKEVYSYDYAPFWHLKTKTKYLKKTQKEVCFIFVLNKKPDNDFFGENEFRHKESKTLKKIKELIRNKFNPYENNSRTHNHVIHATDSEIQAIKLLEYLGYKSNNYFNSKNRILLTPYYMDKMSEMQFKIINCSDLYCNILVGRSWNDYSTKIYKVEDSPHFLGLIHDKKNYENYVEKFLGGGLQQNYTFDKFINMTKSFKYLTPPYQNSFIIVKKINDKYIIQDGLHRACSHVINKNNKIKVCQILK